MNSQFYHALRKEIFIAFNAEKASNRSQVPDNLAEGGASKPVVLHDKAGNVTGQYDRIYAVATRPKGSSTCPLHDNAFNHAKIVRAVNQLPEYCNALAMYCYAGKSTDWGFITLVAEYAWYRMELFIDGWQRFKCSELKPEKVEKLRTLTFSALLHYREGAMNRRKLYTVEMLSHQLGVSDANWRRDWGPFWNQLLNILASLDEQTLLLVARNSKGREAA